MGQSSPLTALKKNHFFFGSKNRIASLCFVGQLFLNKIPMKDYVNYDAEDFAQDDFFVYWVKSTSISAETFWQNWLETYPFKRTDVENARQLVLITQNMPEAPVSDSEISVIKESIFERIDSLENRIPKVWSLDSRWLAAAVVSGLLFFAGWYLITGRQAEPIHYTELVSKAAEKYDLKEVSNRSMPAMLVNLPDGSSAILKKGSKLSFPNQFAADSREIYLTGEAFFEVARNPQKPFYVYANEMVTKVLGTSFNVRAYQDDKEILVTVKTGRVSVYRVESKEAKRQSGNSLLEGLVLSPNQEAIFKNNEIALVKRNDQPKVAISAPEIKQMSFEYSEKPLSEIFNQLEIAYNIEIVYDSTVIGKCPVTASLTGEPMYEKLKLLCKAVQARYEVVNGEIIITGKGCD